MRKPSGLMNTHASRKPRTEACPAWQTTPDYRAEDNEMSDQRLLGQVALVVGVTRGAGRAIDLVLGRAGATVYAMGRSNRAARSPMNPLKPFRKPPNWLLPPEAAASRCA